MATITITLALEFISRARRADTRIAAAPALARQLKEDSERITKFLKAQGPQK